MKRFLVIFLVFILAFSSLVLCASASEVGSADPMIQLLDFSTLNNYGRNYVYFNLNAGVTRNFSFNLPVSSSVTYIDTVFYSSKTPTSVKAQNNSLSIINLYDNTYRAYGTCAFPANTVSVSLGMKFAESGTGFIEFLSFKVASGSDSFIQGYCGSSMTLTLLSDDAGVDNLRTSKDVEPDTLGYFGTDGYLGENSYSESVFANRGYLDIYINDSQAYDYFDINLYLTVQSIKSLSCVLDDATIPFTISYLDGSSSLDDIYHYADGDIIVGDSRNTFFINLHLDLSNFKKTDLRPNINISFEIDPGDGNEFYLYSIIGYADVDNLTALDFLWFKIRDLFNGLLGVDTSSFEAAEEFDQTAESQASELDEMVSVMGSVEQPDISNVNLDLTSGIDSNILTATTSGFSTVLSNEILIRVLIMALTLGLVGFILYGKKG